MGPYEISYKQDEDEHHKDIAYGIKEDIERKVAVCE